MTARRTERAGAFAYATAFVLFAAILLGGATHGDYFSSLIARLLSLGLLGWIVWLLPTDRLGGAAHAGLFLLGLAALIALAQLIPLPPALWTKLGDRQIVADVFAAAGKPLPSLPLSLAPDATLDFLAGLSVPAAMFLAAARLNAAGRRLAICAVVLAAVVSLLLSGLQPIYPRLRFYEVTAVDTGVGLFANRNHHAALLVAALPLVIFFALRLGKQVGGAGLAIAGIALAGVLLLIVGLGVTQSRAGVMLGVLDLIGGLAMVLASRRYDGRRALALGMLSTLVIGVLVVGIFLLGPLRHRFEVKLSQESRLTTAPTIIHAAQSMGPLGAGLGTFVPVYQVFEPRDQLEPAYLNHAHDDYLEVWLESGWPGLVLVALALTWIGWMAVRAWRGEGEDAELGRAASLVVAGILLHSLVEYPLRTAALAAVMGFACGLMTEKRSEIRRVRARRDLKHEKFEAFKVGVDAQSVEVDHGA